MIGPRATGDHRARMILRCIKAQSNKLLRRSPIKPHAALCCIHGLCHAKAKRPKMLAKGDGAIPINLCIKPGILFRQRISHNMGSREGDARIGRQGFREGARRAGGEARDRTIGVG